MKSIYTTMLAVFAGVFLIPFLILLICFYVFAAVGGGQSDTLIELAISTDSWLKWLTGLLWACWYGFMLYLSWRFHKESEFSRSLGSHEEF